LSEAMIALSPVNGGRYVDGTAGGGGHTRALLEQVGSRGTVLALDQDPAAMQHLRETLQPDYPNLLIRRSNFSEMEGLFGELGWETVDGMFLDLGISSYQLDDAGRGFSFGRDEPLDMRMDPEVAVSARDLVNRLPERELADLIYRYGEERGSRRVARFIVQARQEYPIETSRVLADVVRRALRRPGKPPRIDPATRTFQALRLAVNREQEHLEEFLKFAPRRLKEGGRLVVISFHSLEDRLVKQAMIKRIASGMTGRFLHALFKKPIQPTPEEVAANPRSRSAKLRAGELIVR
jgi:16S rRNA (cytosine1402-N4)-methyltransferase